MWDDTAKEQGVAGVRSTREKEGFSHAEAMKAAVFVEPGRIELREKPIPEVSMAIHSIMR
jgi:hypothetical protein